MDRIFVVSLLVESDSTGGRAIEEVGRLRKVISILRELE